MTRYLLGFIGLIININAVANSHSFDTAIIAKGLKIQIKTRDLNEDFVILSATTNNQIWVDTIDSGGLSDINFPDFDDNGIPDIMLTYMGNNNSYELYLYNQNDSTYKELEGYGLYPEAVRVRNTKSLLYYSYQRAGCADYNWVSDLIKLENFKIIHLGHIDGKGCLYDTAADPPVIKIFKIRNNDSRNEQPITTLPYLKHIPNFDDKWDFIERYWNKNYSKFE